MNMEKDYCVHPGSIMRTVLMSINKSQKWLAKEMNVNKTVISSILAGKRSVTTLIAAAFEKATGYPADSLLYQQKKYELFQLGKEEAYKSRFEISENKQNTELFMPVEDLSVGKKRIINSAVYAA